MLKLMIPTKLESKDFANKDIIALINQEKLFLKILHPKVSQSPNYLA